MADDDIESKLPRDLLFMSEKIQGFNRNRFRIDDVV